MINLETAKRLSSYGNGLYGNAIINGNFDIWQRGTSFTNKEYTADRWYFNTVSGGARTCTQQSFTVGQTDVPNNPKYFSRFGGTPSGGSYYYIQAIEDVETFSGMTVTVSFYMKSATGITDLNVGFIQKFGSGGSSDVWGSGQGVTLTSSWQKFELTFDIASVSGKTIGAGSSLQLYFTYTSTSTSTVTVDIAQVQLNAGSEALPFCPRSYGEELALCQRYFWRSYADGTVYFASGVVSSTSAGIVVMSVPQKLRVEPTVSFNTGLGCRDGSGTHSVSALTLYNVHGTNISLNITSGGLTVGRGLIAYQTDTNYIDFDAEL